ncbi:RNA polymerase II subunit 5-mediating protein homolog [Impatiens glandulifera]|uniref:RNA polymerase II subunit 5-mediating protein homolog n=1 Tax=Impatiens glandulifera TaxID=253017 RepID=UPI001FB07F21|nr:RNA polymerase II subunit 5-mediating protein homolog [Impatiens glandulifera]XP_047322712.1 RNA polymerase II subunit 5-mediating protein homolog [Impatiens glandulifera]XP_047322713.1 RNA polymerase II subunit 5-mediating protein homolog [Impatiens glandulifera]
MMGEPVRGTVTSLSSAFPAEESVKASRRVHEAITERQKGLDKIQGFISDNTNLINLVQKLPEELHHDIMVPFGKAAFFPGRLIHTNEFLVLLGEGYYADRTSKQTIDILRRRGKTLDTQVESIKSEMKDLKVEASFFESTAIEAAEGLVEIREELDDIPAEIVSKTGQQNQESLSSKVVDDDDEFARIMSRMDELEREELAAESMNESEEEPASESMNGSDEEELAAESMNGSDEEELAAESMNGSEEEELAAESMNGSDEEELAAEDFVVNDEYKPLKDHSSSSSGQRSTVGILNHTMKPSSNQIIPNNSSQAIRTNNMENVNLHSSFEERSSSGGKRVTFADSGVTERSPASSQVKDNVHSNSASKTIIIGSIVEHTHNLNINQSGQVAPPPKLESSKPVSRFKMNRK